MGVSYFHGIGILSEINIFAPYKINTYYHLLDSANLFISYAIYLAHGVCVNGILLYELSI